MARVSASTSPGSVGHAPSSNPCDSNHLSDPYTKVCVLYTHQTSAQTYCPLSPRCGCPLFDAQCGCPLFAWHSDLRCTVSTIVDNSKFKTLTQDLLLTSDDPGNNHRENKCRKNAFDQLFGNSSAYVSGWQFWLAYKYFAPGDLLFSKPWWRRLGLPWSKDVGGNHHILIRRPKLCLAATSRLIQPELQVRKGTPTFSVAP